MRRRALLLGAAALGCSGARQPSSGLAHGLLALAQSHVPTPAHELNWAWAELRHLIDRVAERRSRGSAGAQAVTQVLFDDMGFVREVDDTALRFVVLPDVLKGRRGSCVGLGTVYLCIAEALGFTAHGVLRPGHFYVRQQAPGAPCNVELLRRGELMPDAWYSQRFPFSRPASGSYDRPLSNAEVVGVTAFNIGNERRRRHELEPAARAYGAAISAFPTFAEAHASLGAMQQALGRPELAEQSYARALRLDPGLPGVDNNLALLGSSAPR
ncbi:MAG TPA: transglutaminase family protein [Polyangiaceae bacterium]|nr:transglutaminase family protein [Polyangiaceae bacterium]